MFKAIPKMQTTDRQVNQLQQNIISSVNPVLSNPLVSGIILPGIQLLTGSNTVNHKLNRPLTGWFIVRQRSAASVYDLQDSNKNNSVTLLLDSSADVNVDLFVF